MVCVCPGKVTVETRRGRWNIFVRTYSWCCLFHLVGPSWVQTHRKCLAKRLLCGVVYGTHCYTWRVHAYVVIIWIRFGCRTTFCPFRPIIGPFAVREVIPNKAVRDASHMKSQGICNILNVYGLRCTVHTFHDDSHGWRFKWTPTVLRLYSLFVVRCSLYTPNTYATHFHNTDDTNIKKST